MRCVKPTIAAVVCAIALGTSNSGAQAIPVSFLDEEEWNAAVAGKDISVEGFEDSPPGDLPSGTTDLGLFDVTLSNANIYTEISPSPFSALPSTTLNVFLNQRRAVRSMTWSGFDVLGSLHGLAFDLGVFDVSGFRVEVNGARLNIPANQSGFFGLFDSTPITSVVFSSRNEYFEVDNVRLATSPAAVPLPAPFLLLLSALAGTAYLGRNRRATR